MLEYVFSSVTTPIATGEAIELQEQFVKHDNAVHQIAGRRSEVSVSVALALALEVGEGSYSSRHHSNNTYGIGNCWDNGWRRRVQA